MGFSGNKIDGHSGTQFKHRKAFAQRKKMERAGLYGGKRTTGYWEPKDNKWNNRFRIAVSLIVAVAACIVLLFFVNVFEETAVEKQQQVQANHVLWDSWQVDEEELMKSEYNTVMNYAIIRFEQGRYKSAQYWYQEALSLYPYDWEANLGLTNSLLATCAETGHLCEEAKAYVHFCGTLADRDEAQLNALEIP